MNKGFDKVIKIYNLGIILGMSVGGVSGGVIIATQHPNSSPWWDSSPLPEDRTKNTKNLSFTEVCVSTAKGVSFGVFGGLCIGCMWPIVLPIAVPAYIYQQLR